MRLYSYMGDLSFFTGQLVRQYVNGLQARGSLQGFQNYANIADSNHCEWCCLSAYVYPNLNFMLVRSLGKHTYLGNPVCCCTHAIDTQSHLSDGMRLLANPPYLVAAHFFPERKTSLMCQCHILDRIEK